jgi:HK97 family phage portal protein
MSKNLLGRPVSTDANYESFSRFGFSKNVVVYTAISKIATSCSGINWVLYSKKGRGRKQEIEEHPLLTLWDKPNPLQGTAAFIESVVAFNRIAGNSYIEANKGLNLSGPPLELWPVRPDKMKVIPGANGYPKQYVFSNAGQEKRWDVDPITLTSQIMHWKTFNPLSDWYGLSPLEASMLSLDQNNAGQRWNLALLQNSATPSGVLQMKVSDANPRGELTNEQYERLRKEFETNYKGAKNAGNPMIIEGGLSWQAISLGPKDMDFINNKTTTATDLALALGVPPELMGFGQKTFNNYREARLAFYEETILPMMDSLRDQLNMWLTPAFGEGLWLDYDKDDIEALTWKREQKYSTLQSTEFLTLNEKREAAGFEEQQGLNFYNIGGQMMYDYELASSAKPSTEEGADSTESLTGIQITSMVAVIEAVGSGRLPRDTGVNILITAFNLTSEQAEQIMGEVGRSFTPTAPPTNEAPNNAGPEPREQNDESEDDESEDDELEEDEKGWKSINLLNANEKRKSWKRQNQRRKRLQGSFERDLKQDFLDLSQRLSKTAKALEGKDKKLIEYALLQTESEWHEDLKKTLMRHTRYALEDFGNMVLEEGKSLGYNIEKKANVKFDTFIKYWTETRSGEQIKTITSTNQKTIKKIIGEWTQTAIEDGDSIPELSKFIQSEFEELTPARATRIARTEVAVASQYGSMEAIKSLQIPGVWKEWVTANDSRVRDGAHGGADHGAMNGAEVPLDEKFGVPPDALMDGPLDSSAGADQVINCFHPDSLVTGYFIAGSSFKYVGNMVKVKTKSGRVFTVTKNHPVLSKKGFIPAKDITQGLHLVSYASEVKAFRDVRDVNEQNKPTRIQEIFELLKKDGQSFTRKLIADNFHGDAVSGQSDINVVVANSELLDGLKLFKSLSNLSLEKKDSQLSSLNSLGGFDFGVETDPASTPGNPSFFQLPFNQNGVTLDSAPLNKLLFGLTSKLDALLQQIPRDNSPITTAKLCELVDGSAGLVFFDEVESVEVFRYSGHVYDLQSNSGLLISDGVVVSNCRCVLVYKSKNQGEL